MSENKVYLKSNVVFEPLVDKWYAWSHLVSPATAAMNILERHLAIIESFLDAPEIHAQAVLNPKMRGGPFMDIPEIRIEEVRALKNVTSNDHKLLIDFANAIKQLDKLLLSDAKGFGMEELYKKVPPLLKGYVELYYDRNNNAGFRFYEALLYKSPFYKKSIQNIALWVTNNDERPFCLSTPRLNDKDVIHLNLPFDHNGIDELARMKKVPQPINYIKSLLNLPDSEDLIFDSFFTDQPPAKYGNYEGDAIRMRYFGHACILIETAGLSVLVDPLISYYGYPSEIEHFSFEDLPDTIDYVLITHNHQDHILLETLLPLRHRIKRIVVPTSNSGKLEDPDLKLMFDNIGFKNVSRIHEMETIEFDDATITGLPFIGEHSDLNILTKACFLLNIGGFKLLFLADSRIVDSVLYENIHREIGDVDVLFLGMECDGAPLSWLYGPLITKKMSRDQDNSRRLAGSNCDEGMKIINIFQPKEVYVYAMGQEPWLEFISSVKYTDESNPIVQSNQLIKQCHDRDLIAERLYGEKEILYKAAEVDS
ncbi:MBL fold metallo-hydrolase [Mucilaginibacter sp. P25]|uniref:MBL fold metallo-hydrolase n=1 Tax=Mucilaginibacter sp. P25 TaxID=3423945 RepID=UPI003D7A6B63